MKRSANNTFTGMSLNIDRAASAADGSIKILDENQQLEALSKAEGFQGSLCKFTPASGAASRMFKPLFEEGTDIEIFQILVS